MKKTLLFSAMTAALMPAAHAGLVDSVDARTIGMGGAGVASSYGVAAVRENPARILSEQYSVDVNIIGFAGSVRGAEDTIDDLDDLSAAADNLDSQINAIEALNFDVDSGAVSNAAFSSISQQSGNFAAIADRLEGELVSVGLGLQSGFAVSAEESDWAYAVSVGAKVDVVSTANNVSSDTDRIRTLSTALQDGQLDQTEATALETAGLGTVTMGDFSFDTLNLNTEGRAVAAVVGEVGISLAKKFELVGNKLVVGVTPKVVTLGAIEINEDIDDFDSDDLDQDDVVEENFFSFDVGVTHELASSGLVLGAAIQNVIGSDVTTNPSTLNTTTKVTLDPKLTVGIAKEWESYTVSADLDLTEQELIEGANEATQFFSIGAEAHLARWVSLRAGYQANLADSEVGDTFSAGIGLFKEVVQLSGAVGSDDEYAAALEISVQF